MAVRYRSRVFAPHSTPIVVCIAILVLGASLASQQPNLTVQDDTLRSQLAMRSLRLGGSGRWGVISEFMLVDATSGRLFRILPDYLTIVATIPHPKDDSLVTVTNTGSIVALDVGSGSRLWATPALWSDRNSMNDRPDVSAAITPDGRTLVVSILSKGADRDRDGKLRESFLARWDAHSGTEIGRGKKTTGRSARLLVVSDDALWYGNGRDVVDIATGKTVSKLDGDVTALHAGVSRAVLDKGGRKKWRYSGPVCLVDVASKNELACWESRGYRTSVMQFSPDGSRLLVADVSGGGTARQAMLYDAGVGRSLGAVLPDSHRWTFSADGSTLLAFDGQRMISGSLGTPAAQVRATPAPTDGEITAALRTRMLAAMRRSAATLSADGRFFVARAKDGEADVWDTTSGNRLPFRLKIANASSETSVLGPVFVRPVTETGGRVAEWPRVEVVSATPRGNDRLVRQVLRMAEAAGAGAQMEAMRAALGEGLWRICVSQDNRFEVFVERGASTRTVLRAAADERVLADLTAQRIDLSHGCSISHDGRRLVTAGVVPEGLPLPAPAPDAALGRSSPAPPPSTDEGLRRRLLGQLPVVGEVLDAADAKRRAQADEAARQRDVQGAAFQPPATSLVVYDLESARVVTQLQNDDGKPGTFELSATDVSWSADGRFLAGHSGGAFTTTFAAIGGGAAAGIASRPLPWMTSWMWDAASGQPVQLPTAVATMAVHGFLPGAPARVMLSAPLSADVEVWDLRTRSLVGRVPDAAGWSDAIHNGIVAVGPGLGDTLWIRSASTAELLGELRVIGGGDWLVTTPSGLFDGSPAGWRGLAWRDANGTAVGDGEMYFDEYYEPGLLARLLRGQPLRAVRPLADRDRRQPIVTITARAVDGATTATVTIQVREAATLDDRPQGSGARDLRLFRNGSLVRAWRGSLTLDATGAATVEATVPLAAGTNTLTAYVFNRDDVKSADATATVNGAAVRAAPTTYVLAIGVNRYAHAALNLRYAAPDAQAISTEIARRQQQFADGRAIRVVPLLDTEATRANILLALARLGGTHTGAVPPGTPGAVAGLTPSGPEDTVVVYFAGHGVARGDRFHLIPADAGADVALDAPDAFERVLAGGITDRDLEQALEPLHARHLALIIDACQSGQALGSDAERFGPMNSRGLAQLAYEKGIAILVASQAYQAALESEQLGHGYLTFALVEEGLKTRAADSAPADGELTVTEWFAHAVRRVPELQAAALDNARTQGRELRFALDVPTALQTPRVFARRDASEPPFVIARE
jgi:hypothetical protein